MPAESSNMIVALAEYCKQRKERKNKKRHDMVAFLSTVWKISGISPHFTTHTKMNCWMRDQDVKGKEIKQKIVTENIFMSL